jgi:hypothetical protein
MEAEKVLSVYNEPIERTVRVVQATEGLLSKSYYVKLTGNEINYNVTGEKLPNGKFKFKISPPENFEVKETLKEGIVLQEKETEFLSRKTELETREHVKLDEELNPILEKSIEVKEKDYDEVNAIRQEVLVYDKLKFKHSGKEDLIDRKEDKGKYYYEIETDEEHFKFGDSTGEVDLLTDLVSYYKFDETSGTTVNDSHGEHDGTVSDAAAFTSEETGIINTAVDINGGFVSIPDSDDWYLTGNFTVSMWVYRTGNQTNYWESVYIGQTEGAGALPKWAYYENTTDGKIGIDVYNSGFTSVKSSASASLARSTWNHIVIAKSGTTYKVYINGDHFENISNTRAHANVVSPLRMGYNEGNVANRFKGKFDEIGVWSRELTTDEVSALYNSGNGLSYDNFDLSDVNPNVKILGEFLYKPSLVKISGTFVAKPTLAKVGGTFV